MPPRVSRLLKTAWTSEALLLGWRHFHVVGLRRGERGWEAELAASCEPTCRVTVPARALLDQHGWRAGWTPKAELS
jgi:tryptophan-rich hypothetical protein